MDITARTAVLVAAAAKDSGYSDLALAKETLIPRTTLQRKLAGETPFTVTDVYKIARVLGVPAASLLPEDVAA